MSTISDKIKKFPNSPGVYVFKDQKGNVLYIGKAASLKSRVRSYFAKNLNYERPIEFVVDKIAKINIKQTDTVIEAYFLEQELIKKHQPKYNVDGKDDKSFVYVCVTKEDFPRFLIKRKTDLEQNQKSKIKNQNDNSKLKINKELKEKYTKIYGPYAAKHLVEKALRILRKIFPYHNKKAQTEKGCLDYQIGLCPGPHDGAISQRDYLKNIRGIEMMMKGKKKTLIKGLEKEMKDYSKKQDFEKAAEKRNQIFSLKHIQDIAMIGHKDTPWRVSTKRSKKALRIEGYDISNISGRFCVGSMVVFDNKNGELEPNKGQYRKFKIKTVKGIDDVAAMREVLLRRFRNDWELPNLILIDGGRGHLNMVERLFSELKIKIPILAVAKGPARKKLDLRFLDRDLRRKMMRQMIADESLITQIRDEAHRFAISYHRLLRKKSNKA